MMLGKRPRQPIKRTTSMTEFAFDPSKPAPPDFPVSPPLPGPDSSAAPSPSLPPDQMSARVTRRHSADYGLSASAPHFLKSCGLCKRRFVPGRDIYMYRGDSAFCSLECRQQQMVQDERKERLSLAAARKAAANGGRSKVTAEGEAGV